MKGDEFIKHARIGEQTKTCFRFDILRRDERFRGGIDFVKIDLRSERRAQFVHVRADRHAAVDETFEVWPQLLQMLDRFAARGRIRSKRFRQNEQPARNARDHADVAVPSARSDGFELSRPIRKLRDFGAGFVQIAIHPLR